MGDCGRARAALTSTDTDADRLAAARCALDLGRPEDALADLRGVSGFSAWVAWIRLKALVDLQRWEEALSVDISELPTSAKDALEVERGRAQGALGRPTPWLEAHTDRSDARFYAASAAAQRGDSVTARRLWLQGWADASLGGWDQRAAESLAGLGTSVADVQNVDVRAAARTRVSSLSQADRNIEALALLESLSPSPDVAQAARYARLATAAKAYPKAIDWWTVAHGPAASATAGPKDLFDHALTYARADDYENAAVVYRRLMAQHPATDEAEFASFKLGYMLWDRGDCAAAIPLLLDVKGSHLDEALWFAGRCRWRAGDQPGAIELMGRLQRETPRSTLVAGAAYWTARGKPEGPERAEALRSVRSRWPVSLWAWFIPSGPNKPARNSVPIPLPAELAEQPTVQRVLALRDAGLLDWAATELRSVRWTGSADPLPVASLRFSVGEYASARKLAQPACSDPRAKALCSPLPERDLVSRVAKEHGLDPVLAWGVMEAESSLDPSVTSPVGARGLMQLMPTVAKSLHEALMPGTPFEPDRLYQGRYNAWLGTSELGRLQNRYKTHLGGTSAPAVVAAYNAGTDAVDRWLVASDGDPASFADDIPWTETRRYVRRVLSVALDVRRVWGLPAP